MNDFPPPNDGPIEGRREDVVQQTDSEDRMTIDSASTQEEWRRIAQLMQQETSTEKLMELAQQLISEFDKHQSPKLPASAAPSNSTGSCITETTKDEDGLMHGEQHGTTGRPAR